MQTTIDMVRLLVLLLVLSITPVYAGDVYNPGYSSVGDYPDVDNPSGSSTLACSYTPVTTGTQNVAYTGATPSASGGVPAYTFSETGSLPSGLSISSSTGVISGTPTVSGMFPGIQVKVADTVPTTVNCGLSFTLVISVPPYSGPGDVVASAVVWGSCARVYDAALASTSTSLCDLVDSSAPTVVICTLRGTSSGFVDLAGSYCTGGVTPATKCAAATGGVCNISKIYDQSGNSNHWTEATAANQATLAFSSLNGLPGIKCAASCVYATPNITQAQPFTLSYVSERTAAFTTLSDVFSISGGSIIVGYQNLANTAIINAGGGPLTATASDSAFHAFQSIPNGNGTSSTIVVDGSATAGAAGTTGLSATALRLMTANGAGASLTGIAMEAGLWSGAFNSTQYGNMNSNQHSATNGYNF
jgi:Putative Ig domain